MVINLDMSKIYSLTAAFEREKKRLPNRADAENEAVNENEISF